MCMQRHHLGLPLSMVHLTYYILRLFHLFHSFLILIQSIRKRVVRHDPLPLSAVRRRVPTHLAVIFAAGAHLPIAQVESHLAQSAQTLVEWCRTVGIQKLTLYDSEGEGNPRFTTVPLLNPFRYLTLLSGTHSRRYISKGLVGLSRGQ